MKIIKLFTIFLLCFNISFSQETVISDSSKIFQTIKFNKVKKSFREANTAIMQLNYLQDETMGLVKFKIPSFIFRLTTTLSDYCIIETRTKKITLQNKVEIATNERDLISYYDFTFPLSKDSLLNIVSDEIKKVTFYFMPNTEIKKYLKENRLINKAYDKLMIRNSKKAIKIIISKPDKIQYNEVLSWLNKL